MKALLEMVNKKTKNTPKDIQDIYICLVGTNSRTC